MIAAANRRSSYLNTAPLIWSFIHGLRRDAVNLLTDKRPRVALRCSIAAKPMQPWCRSSNINACWGSKLFPTSVSVRALQYASVVIATKLNNLKKVKRVALDDSSRTSVALIKILFREFLGFEPEWVTSPPDLKSMLTHADAALIIGDPAMKIREINSRYSI